MKKNAKSFFSRRKQKSRTKISIKPAGETDLINRYQSQAEMVCTAERFPSAGSTRSLTNGEVTKAPRTYNTSVATGRAKSSKRFNHKITVPPGLDCIGIYAREMDLQNNKARATGQNVQN